VGKFKDENLTYDVAYADYPETDINSDYKFEIVDEFMKNLVTTVVSDVKGTLISNEKTHFKDFPGMHIKINHGDGQETVNMKIYLIKNRVYFLKVTYRPDKDKNTSIGNFFNSFELLSDGQKKK
jgi:hypothetical protein